MFKKNAWIPVSRTLSTPPSATFFLRGRSNADASRSSGVRPQGSSTRKHKILSALIKKRVIELQATMKFQQAQNNNHILLFLSADSPQHLEPKELPTLRRTLSDELPSSSLSPPRLPKGEARVTPKRSPISYQPLALLTAPKRHVPQHAELCLTEVRLS